MRIPTPAVAAGVVVVLGLDLFLVYGSHRVDPVTLPEARARFRAAREFAGLPGWDRALDGPRPQPGVYSYTTRGFAKVDRLGVRREYPGTTYRVVTHGPGCQWRETLPIFAEHVETYSVCATDGDQLDTGFGTDLTYFLMGHTTEVVCEPGGTRTAAGFREGESRTYACADDERGLRVETTVTYLGDGTSSLLGFLVPCRRVRVVSVLSGSSEGVAGRDLCVQAANGAVLAETRNVGIATSTPLLGRVRYVEEATFTLAEPTPRV